MKISIETVQEALEKQKVEPSIVVKVIKELNEVIQDEQDNKVNLPPKAKNEFLIVLSDPESQLMGKEFVGWVIQQSQGQDAATAIDKIKEAGKETEEARKRKKTKFTSLAEIFEGAKRCFLKSKGILIKTKTPVRILITDGKM